MTVVLLDRLTHRCGIFEINGESYRFRESMKSKKGRKLTKPICRSYPERLTSNGEWVPLTRSGWVPLTRSVPPRSRHRFRDRLP